MEKDIAQRTRQDFFYFLTSVRFFANYNNTLKDNFGDDYLSKVENLREKISKIEKKQYSKKGMDKILENIGFRDFSISFFQLRAYGTITIVFSALCLEALINDYCITKKSANYFNQYIDKLDPPSKWLLIPQLIAGKEFSSDSKAFELIKNLFSIRNKLVHPKSKQLDQINIHDKGNPLFKDFTQLLSYVPKSFRAIKEATQELHKIDPSFKHLAEYEWLWSGDMSKFKNLSDPESVYLSMVDRLSFNNK